MNAEEAKYLRTVAELQEIARRAPYVTQEWVLEVASMDPADMRRRLIRSNDWHGHFACSLDGIPEIRNLPGAGIDGCRTHKEVRAVVLGLLEALHTSAWIPANDTLRQQVTELEKSVNHWFEQNLASTEKLAALKPKEE